MAAKKPIIASNIPALRGLLRHKENAYLVTPDSGKDIANAAKELISNSGLCKKMVEQSWMDVQKYNWEKRAENILKFILKL